MCKQDLALNIIYMGWYAIKHNTTQHNTANQPVFVMTKEKDFCLSLLVRGHKKNVSWHSFFLIEK